MSIKSRISANIVIKEKNLRKFNKLNKKKAKKTIQKDRFFKKTKII